MKFQSISIIISLFISLSVSSASEIEDENLIQKSPIPGVGGPWKVYQKIDKVC